MPAPQGHEPYEGGGRPKGVPNKATSKAREAIGLFVDNNSDRLLGWLDRIAENDPEAAFKCFMSVVEYHIPKLQRAVVVGEGEDGSFKVQVTHDISARVAAIVGQLTVAKSTGLALPPEVDRTGKAEPDHA